MMHRWMVMMVVWMALWASAGTLQAQPNQVAGALSVGTYAPPAGSTVRLEGLGTSGGTQVLLIGTSNFEVVRRALAKTDLPGVTGFTDTAQTWVPAQTFTATAIFNGGLTSNGALTIGGANDLIVGTGGIRAGSGSVVIRNVADSSDSATIGDSAIALNRATTVNANLSLSGANDLITGTGGIRTSSGTVDIRNVADSANVAQFGDTAITFFEPLTVNDLVTATGYRGSADPFTVYDSATGATALLRAYDSGRTWIGNTGTDAFWEYNATGNASGSRNWRAGLIGGNFRFEAGNDAGSSWSTLFRSTAAASVANGLYFGPGVRQVGPDQDFTTDLGVYASQYANLWVRNLFATTLVAQNVISTVGGAVLVTPTTKLEAAVSSGATTFLTTHNEMAVNDIAYINDNLQTEFVQVSGGPRAGVSSISFVGEAEAVATSVTLPTHQAGDLLLVFAFRNAATAPSLPGGGWTTLCTQSGGSTSVRVGYLIASGAGTASGTWTNATSVMSSVYRSSAGTMPIPVSCSHDNGAASTSLSYPSLTLSKSDYSSWVARAAMSSAGTNIQSAPAGYTLRSNNTAVPESASFDSNGPILATSVAASSPLTISSANWRSVTVEIVGIGLTPYSYDVTRGYGSVFPARAWAGGVALANTGTTGDGGINMYAIQSIKGSGEQGPTIQGYERTSTTYNALSTRWALGNMKGLFDYGASTVWGAAFGNPSGGWLGIDTTNGIRFMTSGTTQNARFAPDASILLGQSGAGQANTYIDPGVVALRWGTNPLITLSSPGIQMYDDAAQRRFYVNRSTGAVLIGQDGAGQENLYIDSTQALFRVGTTQRVVVNSSQVQINDTAGTGRLIADVNGILLGITAAGNGNIFADTSGNIFMRGGTANRILLEAGNAAVRILDDDGTTTRFLVNNTGLAMYDQAAKPYFYIDTANGVLIGDWTTTNNPFLQLTPSTLQFCRGNSGPCTLQFAGSTGNITSTGSILLSTGGKITSTNNFVLGNAEGLELQRGSSGTDFTNERSITWKNGGTEIAQIGTWTNNALLMWAGRGNGAGIRLSPSGEYVAGAASHGLNITWEETGTGGRLNIVAEATVGWQAGVKDDVTIQFVPLINALSPGVELATIGTPANPWHQIHSLLYYGTSGAAGWSGTCATSLVVSGGIVTGCV